MSITEVKAQEIWEYLGVDPVRDYWYPDLERMIWHVHRVTGQFYEKPIRWQDLTRKGKREHPEMRPK